jgi:3-dehydroquinate dehydratase II
MKKVIVINGPNLNLLGEREPGLYPNITFAGLESLLKSWGKEHKLEIEIFQFNGEGEIIDALQNCRKTVSFGIINPGAYTHYSLAIRDALKDIKIPFIEVHLSNILGREPMRRISITAEACVGIIAGFGIESYLLALEYGLNNIILKAK